MWLLRLPRGKISHEGGEAEIEKAIYGLAASFDYPILNKNGQGMDYSTIEPTTVQFFKNVALSLDHVPKETITTTENCENGELILVQRGWQLFFKFIPTNKNGERIYRYVKQRKYRHCSYSAKILKRVPNEDLQKRASWFLDSGSTVSKKHVGIYEVCLTNNPANNETFCTTDGNHPIFEGIDWRNNVNFLPSDAGDPWEEEIAFSEIQQRFDAFDENVEKILKGLKGN